MSMGKTDRCPPTWRACERWRRTAEHRRRTMESQLHRGKVLLHNPFSLSTQPAKVKINNRCDVEGEELGKDQASGDDEA
jgi:hypothetical protein